MTSASPEISIGFGPDVEVLDIHQHIGPRGRMLGEDRQFDFTTTIAAHTQMMSRYGIDRAVAIASHSSVSNDDQGRSANDIVARACEEHPELFLAGVGTVDPVFGERGGIAEIKRCCEQLGMRGMAWHARFQGTFLDAPPMQAYVRTCTELGLPVFLHAIGESKLEAIWRVTGLARAFPDGRFVVLDAFTSVDNCDWIVAHAGELPNVWFDTGAISATGRVIERFVARHGSARVVFGTTFYGAPDSYAYPAPLFEIAASSIGASDREAILSGNARELLGLSKTTPKES